MEALNKLVESGELNPQELSQIQSILSDSDDEGPDPFKEMSLEDDDHYMTDEELDEQFDNDPSDMDDEEDDEDHNSWQYEEDESDLDDMEHERRGRGPQMTYPDLDDDF
jgi:hypothetical protein